MTLFEIALVSLGIVVGAVYALTIVYFLISRDRRPPWH